MPYDINTTLEQLEQNLTNLDSARKQVENIVISNNDLKKIVSEYVESIAYFRNEILEWEEQLKQSQVGLSSQVQNAFSTLKASCDTVSAGFKISTDETVGKFYKQNAILTERVNELNELRKDFMSVMSEIPAVKDTLTNLTNVLTESQQDQEQVLANIIGKVAELHVMVKGNTDDVVRQMEERHVELTQKIDNSISRIESVIQELESLAVTCSNIQNSCDALNISVGEVKTSVATQQKSLSKSININRWILIAGVVILSILHFI